jgi:hypothetical protein
MELINPKKTNQKRQTRTQSHRDPNEQSDDMNPKKKGKRKRYYPSPKPRVSIKNNKAVKAPTRSR